MPVGDVAASFSENAPFRINACSFVGLAWSPDSTHIAGYDSEGTTHIWNALTDQGQLTLAGEGALHASRYASSPLAWSPDGKQIATRWVTTYKYRTPRQESQHSPTPVRRKTCAVELFRLRAIIYPIPASTP
jgi:WD40 repeat protein